jgi:hypothetical protein
MNQIFPTLGRIVWYRGPDEFIRTAIVTAVNSPFNLNLYVFGQHGQDFECGPRDGVTHADPEQEPGCFPSWHWMPYQLSQAGIKPMVAPEKHEDKVTINVPRPQKLIGTDPARDGSDAAIEQQIQAKGKTAPRVTPGDIEANIHHEHYFTAAEGVAGACDGWKLLKDGNESLGLLTFCVLVLRNGFTVTGESACASPENFDAEIGSKIARQNAVQKIWPLMGYQLRDELHRRAVFDAEPKVGGQQPAPGAAQAGYSSMQPHQQRVVDERAELDDKLSKLAGFFGSDLFVTLPSAEQRRLRSQAEAMRTYSGILAERIAAFAPAAAA